MPDTIPNAHYDSSDFAEPEQALGAWRAIMSVTVAIDPMDDALVPLGNDLGGFRAKADAWAIGRVMFGHGDMSALRAQRSPERARTDGSEHHIFMTMYEGSVTGDFDGQPMACASGSTFAMDKARPFTTVHTAMVCNILSVPRFVLEGATRTARSFHGVVFGGPLGRLFADHMHSTVTIAPQLAVRDAAVVEQTTIQLLAACLLAQSGGPKSDALLSLAARNDIQRYIEENLHRSDLNPTGVYEALSLSRAAAYRAFADTDGIAKYIQKRRLTVARAMLVHPDERRAIAEIADSVGYSDLASFSRAYKRAHGETPSETREGRTMSGERIFQSGRDDDYGSWIGDLNKSLV